MAEDTSVKLNPLFTFEEFVVGPNNRFAYSAAIAVTENIGTKYNPLFIYGGVGLGKTHLMQAIAHKAKEKKPELKIYYITARDFMEEIITAVEKGELKVVREKYRNIDLLLIDDIQFIATSESTQEEFFHIFNELHQNSKQIVLTSDRPPKMLTTLEDRLRSRFEWGLITDIKTPPLETRIAILKKKSTSEEIILDDEIWHFVAQKLKSNVRELEGFVKRIAAYGSLTNQKIDMDLVEEVMKELLPEETVVEEVPQKVTVEPPPRVIPKKIYTAPPQKKPPKLEKISKTPITPPTPKKPLQKHLKTVEVAFFYPEEKIQQLSKVKEKFQEVIEKHNLKFELKTVFDKGYNCSDVNYELLIDLCKTNNIKISIVIGPPSNSSLSNDEFYNSILPLAEAANISLQYIPWFEINKDYRYLNLALDIALNTYKL